MTTKVLLADDQALVRAGFRSLLARARDVSVVGEAATGDEAILLAGSTRPDVILMDIRMPGTDGITATRRIVTDPATAACRVVILTTFDTDDHVFAALDAGASGFLTKDVEPAELRRAVAHVAEGNALLSPEVTRRVIERFGTRRPWVGERLAGLTERELEVVRLVASGLSNDQIAARLVISPMTAKTHITRALAKTGVRDRVQLVIMAYESGLVRPGDGGRG